MLLHNKGSPKGFAAPGCSWLLLAAPGCSWLLLAAPGCSWLLLAASSGKVLSAPGGTEGADAAARTSQVEAVQDQARTRLQAMLDRVVGVGNSTVQVTADLDFASSVTETTDYRADEEVPELSSSTSSEVYAGAAADNQTAGGVVGTDGQAEGDATGGSDSSYRATQKTVDNGVDTVRETRETSPGDVQSWHVGVVLDSNKTGAINPRDVRDLVADAMGIHRFAVDPDRAFAGDGDEHLGILARRGLARLGPLDLDATLLDEAGGDDEEDQHDKDHVQHGGQIDLAGFFGAGGQSTSTHVRPPRHGPGDHATADPRAG